MESTARKNSQHSSRNDATASAPGETPLNLVKPKAERRRGPAKDSPLGKAIGPRDSQRAAQAEGANAGGEQSRSALHMVSLLHQLTMEAILCETKQELAFRILNRTVLFCKYDRAALFEMSGSKPRLLGVSGQAAVAKNSELAKQWRMLVGGMGDAGKPGLLSKKPLPDKLRAKYEDLAKEAPRPAILWLPIHARGALVAGLWLERWEGAKWWDKDIKMLRSLAVSYGAAWEKLTRAKGLGGKLLRASRSWTLLIMAVLIAALAFIPVPLRVVAPSEVVPKDPFVVTAPVTGVVSEVAVDPGALVQEGDLLFKYDRRVSDEELNVARQQVRIIESNLTRVRNQAFTNPNVRAEIALLELELEQERARLRLAEYNDAMMEVRADTSGRVVIDDPNEWRGKPVEVGQRVMMLVNPHSTQARIWLPVDDNIHFDESKPVKINLNAFPEHTFLADLAYVADNVSMNQSNTPSIVAEADWLGEPEGLKLGLQGSASLHGEEVSLGYWVLRKPWGWARRTFGF